jgi:hypothetical protein
MARQDECLHSHAAGEWPGADDWKPLPGGMEEAGQPFRF